MVCSFEAITYGVLDSLDMSYDIMGLGSVSICLMNDMCMVVLSAADEWIIFVDGFKGRSFPPVKGKPRVCSSEQVLNLRSQSHLLHLPSMSSSFSF